MSASPLLLEISSLLRMSAAGREILNFLMESERKRSVAEIVAQIHRSERTVRAELVKLMKHGLVKREVHRVRRGRPIHQYFVQSKKAIINEVRKNVIHRLQRLHRFVKS